MVAMSELFVIQEVCFKLAIYFLYSIPYFIYNFPLLGSIFVVAQMILRRKCVWLVGNANSCYLFLYLSIMSKVAEVVEDFLLLIIFLQISIQLQ